MNIFTINKDFLSALVLTCLLSLSASDSQAASSYNSAAKVTYTINSINNLTNAGDLSGLAISGFSEIQAGYEEITGNGSATPKLDNAGLVSLPITTGAIYSRTFQVTGSAEDGSSIVATYPALFSLSFSNSSTDSYAIDLTLAYELTANTTGDIAHTGVTLDYSDLEGTFTGADFVDTSSEIDGGASMQKSYDFDFILQATAETMVVQTAITGYLAPVPAPSALWLFASALIGLPGFRKICLNEKRQVG